MGCGTTHTPVSGFFIFKGERMTDIEAMNLVNLEPAKKSIEILKKREEKTYDHYRTVFEFCRLFNVNTKEIETGKLGMALTIFCSKFEIPVKSIPSKIFGKINSYPLEIIFYAFEKKDESIVTVHLSPEGIEENYRKKNNNSIPPRGIQ